MAKVVLSLALLSYRVLGEPYYVIADYKTTSDTDTIPFAYTVDICSARGGNTQESVKYECLTNLTVRQTIYEDRECATMSDVADISDEDLDANPKVFTSEDDVEFNCVEGSTHDYIVQTFDPFSSSCTSTSATNSTGATGVCVDWFGNTTMTECDEDGSVQARYSDDYCGNITQELEATSDCAFYEKVPISSNSDSTVNVNSRVQMCVENGILIGGAVYDEENAESSSEEEEDHAAGLLKVVLTLALSTMVAAFLVA